MHFDSNIIPFTNSTVGTSTAECMIFHNMPHILPQKDAGFPFTEELAHPRWLDVSESLPGGNDQNDQPGVAGLECSHTQLRCNVFVRKHGNLNDYRAKLSWSAYVPNMLSARDKWLLILFHPDPGPKTVSHFINHEFIIFPNKSTTYWGIYHGIQHISHIALISAAPPSAHPRSMRPLLFQQSPGMPFDYALPGILSRFPRTKQPSDQQITEPTNYSNLQMDRKVIIAILVEFYVSIFWGLL